MKILSKEELKIELDNILTYGVNDINPDAEDISLITKDKDLVLMGTYENSSAKTAHKVISSIIPDFEKNGLSFADVNAIFVHFQINTDYNLRNIEDAMKIIYNKCDAVYFTEEPDVMFSTSCDDSLDIDYVKATVFVGYSKKS